MLPHVILVGVTCASCMHRHGAAVILGNLVAGAWVKSSLCFRCSAAAELRCVRMKREARHSCSHQRVVVQLVSESPGQQDMG